MQKIAKGLINQARTLLKLKYLKNDDTENVLRLGWFNGRTLKGYEKNKGCLNASVGH